jgi:hypothetical protein
LERANDQVELSGGWGMGMFVGSVGLKFSNFLLRIYLIKKLGNLCQVAMARLLVFVLR